MKSIVLSSISLIICVIAIMMGKAGILKSKVEEVRIVSESLAGNIAKEDPERSLIIYLPPGYEEDRGRHYPCLYYLHGFTSDNNEFHTLEFEKLLNRAIASGALPACIVVFPNSYNSFYGSFYTNSNITGKWADYICKDVVQYMDRHYRTIPESSQRIISGHSMGGNGAIKIAMDHPELFGLVYALSPSALGWSDDFSLDNPSFELISKTERQEDFKRDFYSMVFMAMGRSYSADINSKYWVDLPVRYENGQRIVDSATLYKWNTELPLYRMNTRLEQIRQLKAIGLEYGKQDEFEHIPTTCELFKRKLDSAQIKCHLNSFDGLHYDKLSGTDGRIVNGLFKFMNNEL